MVIRQGPGAVKHPYVVSQGVLEGLPASLAVGPPLVFRAWAKHDYLQGGQLLPVFNPATLEPTITTSAFSIVFSSTQGFIIHDELYSWRPTQEN